MTLQTKRFLGLLLALLLALPAIGAPPPAVTLRQVASGLSSPLDIAHAGDGSQRLFIAEKGGLIRILKDGAILPTPFLNVSSLTSTESERGLLGLAFHPQYASNRRFFIFYTQVSTGALRVSSFLASAGNPDIADPSSEREVITIPHGDNANHNGGRITFGPDGYLYVATGDGGAGGDPPNNAQTLSTLLGKILRLDVSAATGYAIPPGNPFIGVGGARSEIWAYGLRNPWRFSFDRATGDLYIGDVGQGTVEEIDFAPAGAPGGNNYGWRVFEGGNCYNPPSGCSLANHVPPVLTYLHDSAGGFSVTGGFVYRGAESTALRGYYIFGDFVSNRVWAAVREGSAWAKYVLIAPPSALSGVSTFGEDESGELYVASYNNGRIYAIDGPPPGVGERFDLNGDAMGDVMWRNPATQQNWLWMMNGTAISGQGPLVALDANWEVQGIGDVNGDGRSDIVWRNMASGQPWLWMMNGTSIVSDGPLPVISDLGWQIVGVADLNADGRSDIVWRNGARGENWVWLMNGTTITAQGPLPTLNANWQVQRVADMNGDGRADILWRDQSSGQPWVWLMDGTTITTSAPLPLVSDLGWQIVALADLNGDTRADVVWRHNARGENWLWMMSGSAIINQGPLTTVADAQWQVQNAVDLNGDGRADLVWRHIESGQPWAWIMNGAAIANSVPLPHVPDLNWQIVRK